MKAAREPQPVSQVGRVTGGAQAGWGREEPGQCLDGIQWSSGLRLKESCCVSGSESWCRDEGSRNTVGLRGLFSSQENLLWFSPQVQLMRCKHSNGFLFRCCKLEFLRDN